MHIYSYNKYLLNIYYGPGIILDTKDTAVKKTNQNPAFMNFHSIKK